MRSTHTTMKTVYTHYKNSNTGQMLRSQEFTETTIKAPKYFYNLSGECVGENLVLDGYVQISEKKWNVAKRKLKK